MFQLDAVTITAILGGIGTVIGSLSGYFLKRRDQGTSEKKIYIDSIDDLIDRLECKISTLEERVDEMESANDALRKENIILSVRIAELEVRLEHAKTCCVERDYGEK